jgi:acetyl-CoA acetyltransferase
MRDVIVAGVGMTTFGKFFDRSVRSLAEEALNEALKDASIEPKDVGMVFFANAVGGVITTQEMIRGQSALHHTGLLGVPILNVENACASSSSAVSMAKMAVASGAVDIAIAIGAEKLTHADKIRSLSAIGTAIDMEDFSMARDALSKVLLGWPPPEATSGGSTDAKHDSSHNSSSDNSSTKKNKPRTENEKNQGGGQKSAFMDVYGLAAQLYMQQSGATAEDFAKIASKNHANGALNPKAQYRHTVSVQEVLDSRMVSNPLTLLMCSPIGDGAAAVVLTSREVARKLGVPMIKLRASVMLSGKDRSVGEPSVATNAAKKAYEITGVSPEDLNVVELHDAAAPAELMLYEELGLTEEGGGPNFLASKATYLGGKVPVNPSGGLLSKGHPIGATGCAQIVELTEQLRGHCGARQVEKARVALAENGGGFLGTDAAAAVVSILTK